MTNGKNKPVSASITKKSDIAWAIVGIVMMFGWILTVATIAYVAYHFIMKFW